MDKLTLTVTVCGDDVGMIKSVAKALSEVQSKTQGPHGKLRGIMNMASISNAIQSLTADPDTAHLAFPMSLGSIIMAAVLTGKTEQGDKVTVSFNGETLFDSSKPATPAAGASDASAESGETACETAEDAPATPPVAPPPVSP